MLNKTSIIVCSAVYCHVQEQKYAYVQPCSLPIKHQLHSSALLLELLLSSVDVFNILELIIQQLRCNIYRYFDVFLNVHHSIDFFQITNLMHTSFIP